MKREERRWKFRAVTLILSVFLATFISVNYNSPLFSPIELSPVECGYLEDEILQLNSNMEANRIEWENLFFEYEICTDETGQRDKCLGEWEKFDESYKKSLTFSKRTREMVAYYSSYC